MKSWPCCERQEKEQIEDRKISHADDDGREREYVDAQVLITHNTPALEFGKHIGKGLWAFANKALPAVYGVLFMLLVIRILPAEEYGSYLLFQTVFLLISTLANSLAIQPMLKYVAEGMDSARTSSSVLTIVSIFIGVCVAIVLALGSPLAHLLDTQYADNVRALFVYLPALFAVTIYRLIASGLLQAKLQINRLFIIDATSYLCALLLILVARAHGLMTNARILVQITILSSLAASLTAFFLSRHIAVPSFRWHSVEGKKILGYGKFSLGSTVGSVVQTQFDTFFVSAYGGVNGVAVYGAAKNFTRLFDMYLQGIQMLVVPATSMLQGRNEEYKLPALVEKAICFSFYAILPAIIFVELFPDLLFTIFYGGRYIESIPILRVLTLAALFVPWAAVISSVLYGLGKTSIGFIFSIVIVVLSFCIYGGLGSRLGVIGVSWGIVLVQLLIIPAGVVVVKRFVPFTLASTFRRTADIFNYLRKT